LWSFSQSSAIYKVKSEENQISFKILLINILYRILIEIILIKLIINYIKKTSSIDQINILSHRFKKL